MRGDPNKFPSYLTFQGITFGWDTHLDLMAPPVPITGTWVKDCTFLGGTLGGGTANSADYAVIEGNYFDRTLSRAWCFNDGYYKIGQGADGLYDLYVTGSNATIDNNFFGARPHRLGRTHVPYLL